MVRSLTFCCTVALLAATPTVTENDFLTDISGIENTHESSSSSLSDSAFSTGPSTLFSMASSIRTNQHGVIAVSVFVEQNRTMNRNNPTGLANYHEYDDYYPEGASFAWTVKVEEADATRFIQETKGHGSKEEEHSSLVLSQLLSLHWTEQPIPSNGNNPSKNSDSPIFSASGSCSFLIPLETYQGSMDELPSSLIHMSAAARTFIVSLWTSTTIESFSDDARGATAAQAGRIEERPQKLVTRRLATLPRMAHPRQTIDPVARVVLRYAMPQGEIIPLEQHHNEVREVTEIFTPRNGKRDRGNSFSCKRIVWIVIALYGLCVIVFRTSNLRIFPERAMIHDDLEGLRMQNDSLSTDRIPDEHSSSSSEEEDNLGQELIADKEQEAIDRNTGNETDDSDNVYASYEFQHENFEYRQSDDSGRDSKTESPHHDPEVQMRDKSNFEQTNLDQLEDEEQDLPDDVAFGREGWTSPWREMGERFQSDQDMNMPESRREFRRINVASINKRSPPCFLNLDGKGSDAGRLSTASETELVSQQKGSSAASSERAVEHFPQHDIGEVKRQGSEGVANTFRRSLEDRDKSHSLISTPLRGEEILTQFSVDTRMWESRKQEEKGTTPTVSSGGTAGASNSDGGAKVAKNGHWPLNLFASGSDCRVVASLTNRTTPSNEFPTALERTRDLEQSCSSPKADVEMTEARSPLTCPIRLRKKGCPASLGQRSDAEDSYESTLPPDSDYRSEEDQLVIRTGRGACANIGQNSEYYSTFVQSDRKMDDNARRRGRRLSHLDSTSSKSDLSFRSVSNRTSKRKVSMAPALLHRKTGAELHPSPPSKKRGEKRPYKDSSIVADHVPSNSLQFTSQQFMRQGSWDTQQQKSGYVPKTISMPVKKIRTK